MTYSSPVLYGSSVLLYIFCNYAKMYLTKMVRLAGHGLGGVAFEGLKRPVASINILYTR